MPVLSPGALVSAKSRRAGIAAEAHGLYAIDGAVKAYRKIGRAAWDAEFLGPGGRGAATVLRAERQQPHFRKGDAELPEPSRQRRVDRRPAGVRAHTRRPAVLLRESRPVRAGHRRRIRSDVRPALGDAPQGRA